MGCSKLAELIKYNVLISELACCSKFIDVICCQVFVETLDKCFENVCELDLIFHVDKVCCDHL